MASCRENYFSTTGETWGTYYHIVYSGSKDLADSVRVEMASIDAELSMFNPGSTVSAVNAGALAAVGPRFAEVLELSKRVCEWSGGVYDTTVGPLVDLWGFGRADFVGVPSDSAIAVALQTVGIMECFVDSIGNVIKKSPETRFDFSSIAKGYGIDCIGRMLRRNGVADYMIEIGGEVLVEGLNPKGLPWRIQIDSPEGGYGHEALEVRSLGPRRTALASSGNYRNYRIDSVGVRYGHIVSPLTGRPAETSVLAVTVECDDCALADALATACMASGSAAAARDILRKANAEGVIVALDSCGSASIICTDGF